MRVAMSSASWRHAWTPRPPGRNGGSHKARMWLTLAFSYQMGCPNPRSSECGLIWPSSRTASCQCPVNHHSGHRANPQTLGPASDIRVSHVEDCDLAGGTGQALDHLDGLCTYGTSRAENLNLSFAIHERTSSNRVRTLFTSVRN